MIPVAVFERIVNDNELNSHGITSSTVFELQSVDERPLDTGYFVILNWQESSLFAPGRNSVNKAPRILTVWVHTPLDRSRDYAPIDRILNRIDSILLSIEQEIGTDGVRVTCVTRQGRSANLIDDGWKTIARNATYGVLYDESTA